jgi:hypothetical protein
MNRFQTGRKLFAAAALAAIVAVGAGTSNVAEGDDQCAVLDVDYITAGNLLVKDTPFGAGDGVYRLGTGKMRVRFEIRPNRAEAKLMSYEVDNHLTIKASFALWSTTVETRSRTVVANTCEGAARGELAGGDIVWSTPVAGYRSDGTIECEGNACGKFGAPPPGASALHEADDVVFKPFHFSPDGKTFTMNYAKVSHSESPKQTNYLGLSGRETKRVCVIQPPACP